MCYIPGVIALLSMLCVLPAYSWAARAQAACHTETKKKLRNVSGVNFEITYTDCDILAKEAWISVYASRVRAGEKSASVKRSDENLLFRYDPAMWKAPLPRIESTGENKFLIVIDRVSEIIFQKREWDGITVDYQIGKIDYPDTHQSQPPR